MDSAGNEYDGQEKEEDGGEKSFFGEKDVTKLVLFCHADSDWSSGGSEKDYDEEEDLVPKEYHLHLRNYHYFRLIAGDAERGVRGLFKGLFRAERSGPHQRRGDTQAD